MNLNLEQEKAVKHKEGPLLVLAGAGSGKTRIVTHRIMKLIESGVHPSSILAITFTNKAAGEMRERIQKLLCIKEMPLLCTFHSLGTKILRESIHNLGYSSNFTIYDEEDSGKLLRACIQKSCEKKDEKNIRSLISKAKDRMISPEEYDVSDMPMDMRSSFKSIYSLYQTKLKEANALDFDDLLYVTVQLFQKCPDVLQQYQKRWNFLLIDEYQDTNYSQYLMARLIAGRDRNIFAVGDPDQSIYSWRGANINNILNFERDYPGTRVIFLEQNYRSSSTILGAANSLIRNNVSRYEKKLWSDRDSGEKISIFLGETEKDEAEFITGEISNLHRIKQMPLNEICIFYRTNFQSRIFEDFLLRKSIPYVIVGGLSFYQRKEIKDIISFLRMLVFDQDIVSFERTVNLPKRGIGAATMEKIRSSVSEKKVPILSCCQLMMEPSDNSLSKKQKEGIKEYISLIQNLRELRKTASLQKLIAETIRQSQYIDVLQEDRETFKDRKDNIDELVAKGFEFENTNSSNDLQLFLEEISLRGSLDEATFGEEKVNLMTIHNGKGLEFRVAFLAGMEEDLFPHINSKNSSNIEEERRLCYVGMTRAKERLYFSAANSRFLWGMLRSMRPSRFLQELPQHSFIKKIKRSSYSHRF